MTRFYHTVCVRSILSLGFDLENRCPSTAVKLTWTGEPCVGYKKQSLQSNAVFD